MFIGYARGSPHNQTLTIQQDALKTAGCSNIFTDIAGGGKTKHQGLDKALSSLRPGDTLVVWRLDRLGTSIKELVATMTFLAEQGIGFKSLTDNKESTIISGNVVEEITKLKQQPGKDIIIDGSASLVQSLMETDLIDEYRFLVQPFIMGRGRRFFPDGTPPTKLRLVESKTLSFGSLALAYQPANK
jgi:hypothetical protein